MNDDLVHRLLFAETDFLDALQNGPQMLAAFRDSLSDLLSVLLTASKMGKSQNNETLSLAHSVASRISNIANCYLRVKHGEDDFSAQLRIDCDIMLHQMAALDLNADPKSLQTEKRNETHANSNIPFSSSTSPFLASAHQWLVDNLHNPYPTADVKARIAAAFSCEISSVNSWFIDARRRIGWTTLCRERFSNCRADMIDAAHRALVEEDRQRPLSPELRHSFVAMKVSAEGIYTSPRNAFAGALDAIVNKKGEKSMEYGEYDQVEQENLTKTVQDSYPSPDPSSTTSPTPAFDHLSTDEVEEGEDAAPTIIISRKRRRSSIVSVDELSSTACRPVKRLRASRSSRTCLPSPPTSTDGIGGPSDQCLPGSCHTHITPPETNTTSSILDRCLSDMDATEMPKRTGECMATRLDAVSDPLPRYIESEHSIDDWFNTNFDALFTIPPPVDTTQLDLPSSWELELFTDYNLSGDPKCAPKGPPALADSNIPAPSALSDFDNLFQSIGGDLSVTPPHASLSSNTSGALWTTSVDPSIPDISQTNTDGMALVDDPGTCEPYSTFPQCPIDPQPLPEIDLSMIQLPHLMPAVSSQRDFSKQARLDQFHAMQEAVWRMERELQSEGILV